MAISIREKDLLKSAMARYIAKANEKPFRPHRSEKDEEAVDKNEVLRSAAYAAWAGKNTFQQGPASSPDQADRVDPTSGGRQPVAASQDRADPVRRRWLDTLLDTNMDRSGIGRPVKTGPQPIKPLGRGLLDALREALDNNDGYSDPIRGTVSL